MSLGQEQKRASAAGSKGGTIGNEGSSISKKDVRKVQDYSASGAHLCHL